MNRSSRQKGVSAVHTTPLSLLDRIRTRDADAWRRLIELYQPLVRFWCSRGGLHGSEAEDVAQEIFAAAAAHLDSFHHDQPGDTFRGWLRSIARNQVRLHYRRNQGRPQAEGGSDASCATFKMCRTLLRISGMKKPPR